jgi:hypothetical protein
MSVFEYALADGDVAHLGGTPFNERREHLTALAARHAVPTTSESGRSAALQRSAVPATGIGWRS